MLISKEMPIEKLNMSGRSFNCLKRHDINTVEDLSYLSREKLLDMRNMGAKSVNELVRLIDDLNSGRLTQVDSNDNSCDIKRSLVLHYIDARTLTQEVESTLFKRDDDQYVEDCLIKDLNFSKRTTGALLRMKCTSAKNLICRKVEELNDAKGMGQKCIDEIINKMIEITLVCLKSNNNSGEVEIILNSLKRDIEKCCDESETSGLITSIRVLLLQHTEIFEDTTAEELLDTESFFKLIYSDATVERLVSSHIINYVGDGYVYYSEIKNNIPISYLASGKLDELLYEMKSEKLLDETAEGYCAFLPWIADYIMDRSNEKAITALKLRLEGNTLEETGFMLGITRERARQLAKRALQSIPRVREERFVYWYENYEINEEDFKQIFQCTTVSYNYLELICQQKGTKSIEEIFEDENATDTIIIRLKVIIKKYMVRIEDEYVPLRRDLITKKLLEKYYSDCECEISKFYEFYQEFLKANHIDNNEKLLYTTERAFEARISDSNYALQKYGRKTRYYNIQDYDLMTLFKSLCLENYSGLEISTSKLFNIHTELMQEYNLHDEYELHNLMKKNEDMIKTFNVILGRMPLINIGITDRGKQVEKFLYKIAPIGLYEFCDAYESEFGVKSESVLANFVPYVDKYYHNSMFVINQKHMQPCEIDSLKDILTEDFYFISDIEQKYLELFNNGDTEKINAYNLKTLGFQVYVDYVVRNTYSSVEQYFRGVLLKDEMIDIELLDIRVRYIQSFNHVLEILRKEYTLIEFEQNQYMTFDEFVKHSPYVTRELLREYSRQLPEFVTEQFFTVKSARHAGFVSVLDEVEMSDWFYGALLRSNKNIRYSKVAGGFLFSHADKTITRRDFFEFIFNKTGKIHIYEFISYIEKNYGLKFDRNDIISVIHGSNIHYSSEAETIYQSNKEFLDGDSVQERSMISDLKERLLEEIEPTAGVENRREQIFEDDQRNNLKSDILLKKYPEIYDKAQRHLRKFTEYYKFSVTAQQLFESIRIGEYEELKRLLNEVSWAHKDKGGKYYYSDKVLPELTDTGNTNQDYSLINDEGEDAASKINTTPNQPLCEILKKFNRGFRMGSVLEVNKFKRYYEEAFREKLELHELEQQLRSCGVVFENRIYATSIIMNEDTAKKLDAYIEDLFNTGKNVIYYEAVYSEFNNQFYGQQVYSVDMLKRFMAYRYQGKYCIRREFLSKDSMIEFDPEEEVKQCLFENARSMTYEELMEKLPHIHIEKIKTILATNKLFVRDAKGTYFIASVVDFTDDELRQIELLINNEIGNNGFLAGNKLLDEIENNYPSIYDKMSQFQDIGKRGVMEYYLRNRFSFQSNIISKYGHGYKMQDIFAKYCQKHEYVTIDMLNALKEELDTIVYFDVVYDNMVRINENEFISKHQVVFDVERTDIAVGRFCNNRYVSLLDIEQFALFPESSFTWNIYLLESYIYLFSEKYILMHTATFNAKAAGVIVRKDAGFLKFDDVAADAIAKNDIELTEEAALDYLYNKGYIARRKISTIEMILTKAKIIREKKR